MNEKYRKALDIIEYGAKNDLKIGDHRIQYEPMMGSVYVQLGNRSAYFTPYFDVYMQDEVVSHEHSVDMSEYLPESKMTNDNMVWFEFDGIDLEPEEFWRQYIAKIEPIIVPFMKGGA